MGKGFAISRIRKSKKPVSADFHMKGNPIIVIIMPANSSITIQAGSLCSNSFSADSAVQTARIIKINRNITDSDIENSERIQQGRRAASDPKVPGATGKHPDFPPVARYRITASLES